MTNPITPPTELVNKWTSLACEEEGWKSWDSIAHQAAQWGADMELEACCEWLYMNGYNHVISARLRDARRPKPTTLAEQVTAELDNAVMRGDCVTTTDAMPLLRAAIKRLDELDTTAHHLP